MDASGSVPDRGSIAVVIERLKRRGDFRAAAGGVRSATRAFVLQARSRGDHGAVRVGFTVTRQIGGAVERNRAKRRLREAARLLLPELASPGFDYVFVARGGVTTRAWPRLLDDVKSALIRLAADRDRPAS